MADRRVDASSLPVADPRTPVELPNLDLLRACAVLAVVIDHVLTMIATRLDLAVTPFVWHVGRVGVLTFFVHTSLVLMQSMARTPLSGSRLFAHFYIRRAFRIYPLSILCIVMVLVLGAPRVAWEQPLPRTFGTIASNLLLTQNLTRSEAVLGPMWSLPYEVQMYALLPFLFVLTRRMPLMAGALGLWVASVFAAEVQPHVPGASRLDVAHYSPCFLAGVVAYAGLLSVSPRLPSWSWPLLVLALMAGYVGISLATETIHSPWLGWGYAAIVGLLIPWVRQISSPPLVRVSHLIARYSYGIYLFHLLALWLAFRALPQSIWWATALAVLIGAAMTLAAYHLIETPGIALGVRLARRLVSRTAGTVRASDVDRAARCPAGADRKEGAEAG